VHAPRAFHRKHFASPLTGWSAESFHPLELWSPRKALTLILNSTKNSMKQFRRKKNKRLKQTKARNRKNRREVSGKVR